MTSKIKKNKKMTVLISVDFESIARVGLQSFYRTILAFFCVKKVQILKVSKKYVLPTFSQKKVAENM